MFSLLPILFTLLTFQYSQSLKLVGINNVTITLMKTNETTDVLSYEKFSKNSSMSVQLSYMLLNTSSVSPEKIVLEINSEKTPIEMINAGQEPPRGVKLYILKEASINNEILLQIFFTKFEYAKIGIYNLCLTIEGTNFCAVSYIFSSPIVSKFSKPKLGLEGDPIRITCVYEAYPEATSIVWSHIYGDNFQTANKSIISSNDHVEIKAGKETNRQNDTLFIKNLLKNDSGIYMCTVIANGVEDFGLVKINVKDRWAALYPFIGIVIEVVVLVTAILVYEKYQVRSQGGDAGRKGTRCYDDDDNGAAVDMVDNGVGKEPAMPLTSGDLGNNNDDGNNDNNKGNSVDLLRQREAVTKNV